MLCLMPGARISGDSYGEKRNGGSRTRPGADGRKTPFYCPGARRPRHSRLRVFAVRTLQPMSSRLQEITDWEKLASDSTFKPETMAVRCSVTLRQLQRFFKQQFKQSPAAWMRELRCRRAADLIAQGSRTDAAATDVGYGNSSHFCHEFKKVYGVSPQSFAPGAGGAGVKCRLKAMMSLLSNPFVLQRTACCSRLLAIWHRERQFGRMTVSSEALRPGGELGYPLLPGSWALSHTLFWVC